MIDYNRPSLHNWPDVPGSRLWYAQLLGTPFITTAETREEALTAIDPAWNSGRYNVIDGPPPRPKGRPDDPKPKPSTAIEGDTIAVAFHRTLLKAFHPDHRGHQSYTTNEIVTTINRLWDEAIAK